MNHLFKDNYITATQFADLLDTDVNNLNYRCKTNQIPQPDLVLGRQRFWSKGLVYMYFEELRLSIEAKLNKIGGSFGE